MRKGNASSTEGEFPSSRGVLGEVGRFSKLWLAEITGLALIGVLYYLAARLGLHFSIPPGSASPVWPASGVALAALILKMSPAISVGIWLGAFVANCQTDVSTLTAACFATGNTVAALLAAKICTSTLTFQRLFNSPNDAFLWWLAGMVAAGVAATCGAFNLYWGNYIGLVQMSETWLTWALGDLTGIMILAPALVAITSRVRSFRLSAPRLAELCLAFLLLVITNQFLFGGWLSPSNAQGLLYLPMIGLLWLILRFGLQAVLAGNVLIAGLAIWGTSRNVGAFATELPTRLLDLQVFLNLYAVTGLVMSGVWAQGIESERQRQLLDVEIQATHANMMVAQKIQAGLFPSRPLQGENFVCTGIWQPAEVTSADYFDYVLQLEGSVVLTIADVSGHGLGPALLMAETRAYSRSQINSPTPLTAKVLNLNGFLYEDTEIGRFVTFAICQFSPQTCEMEFIGAGHNGILIREDASWEELSASTFPLGLLPVLPPVHSITKKLSVGDSLFLYTDGFTEAHLPDGTIYGRERLIETLITNRQDDLDTMLRVLVDDVARVSQQETASDDQTAVILRIQ